MVQRSKRQPVLSVAEAGGQVSIERAGSKATGDSATIALAAARVAIGDGAFALGRDASVSIQLSDADRALVLAQLVPADDLLDELEEQTSDDLSGDPRGISDPSIDAGNTIDDRAWGWTRSPDRWHLVPMTDSESIAWLSMLMSASMAGAVRWRHSVVDRHRDGEVDRKRRPRADISRC